MSGRAERKSASRDRKNDRSRQQAYSIAGDAFRAGMDPLLETLAVHRNDVSEMASVLRSACSAAATDAEHNGGKGSAEIAGMFQQCARWISDAKRELSESDYESIKSLIEDRGRQSPEANLGISMLAGLVIGRVGGILSDEAAPAEETKEPGPDAQSFHADEVQTKGYSEGTIPPVLHRLPASESQSPMEY